MLVEIVSHCYARRLGQYARMFCYQLSSLAMNPPKHVEVMLTACVSEKDVMTMELLDWYGHNSDLALNVIKLTEGQMTRRAIGRNFASLQSAADVVWYADCDQMYLDGILDAVPHIQWGPDNDAAMVYPRTIMIHKDHKTGDEYLAVVQQPQFCEINPGDFIEKHYKKAIGGVQVVKGDFAREHGYLKDNQQWQTPRNILPFTKNCFDDVVYRGVVSNLGTIAGVDLPGLYRLRHSECGRRTK